MKYQLLEIEQPCNDRKLIAKVDTMEKLHKILTELTDGKYTMEEYTIGDKILHYSAIDAKRYFEVFLIGDDADA
jgi:hypothetical protein